MLGLLRENEHWVWGDLHTTTQMTGKIFELF